MLRGAIFFSLVASTLASPLIAARQSTVTLPFALRLNASGSKLPELDRARASSFKTTSKSSNTKRQASIDVTNVVVSYTADVGVGNPPTTYSLLIDTGSSNTWVGANKAFQQTSSSVDTGNTVSVTYGSGSFSGEEFIDTVTLSDQLVLTNQSIGVASTSQGFDTVDGILGLGPTDLTQGTVDNTDTVPTVPDSLKAQGTISDEVVGIFYAPTNSESDKNGEITFGGTDSSKITGSISFTPITSTSPANQFWGIDQTITYGSNTPILSATAGIVDTGTTLVLLATDAFDAYMQATGATLDQTTGLLTISQDNFANLQNLNFQVGDATLEFTADGQTFPRALNSAIGGSADNIYLVVADLGSNSGEGLDFINGYTFLERFYSVYDTTNNQVGFATTADTQSTQNQSS